MASVEPTLAGRSATSGMHDPFTTDIGNEARRSGVSWGAVIAGAVVATALSLSFLLLGTGLGFSAVSPWAGEGVSAEGIGFASIVWLILVHIIAGAMGGYLAGRLRTQWTDLHTDEVFFRDTAHGFLVWALSVVVTAALLVSASTAIIGSTAQAGASAVGAAATTGGAAMMAGANGQTEGDATGPLDYFADILFRPERARAAPDAGATDSDRTAMRTEAVRILARGWDDMSDGDRAYLAQLIAQNTGVSQSQAENRIREVQAQMEELEMQARQVADEARSAMAKLSLWTFLGLLIGAFSASFAATIGGRQRDSVHY
ncbi:MULTISPECIES: hypothetical protein [Thioalkalivibrio]|uniref:hypothetical protein n=1 Tax=Thioalkalivibrio TaxID=106633 RepID=UPI00037CDCA9|nr:MULTISPECIES: hypothetical protein [Thioalkalivibrio]OOC49183.1 hypothetical protein B0684_06380 [Thioalkalivibrio versutus]